jgi:hypothetical protein
MDQALNARLEPRLVFRKDFTPERAFRKMEAGDFALRLAQRDDALEASHEPHVELGARRPCPEQVPQFGEHEIVAGVNAERGVRLVEDFAELLFDFGRGALQMRGEPRVDPLADPKKPLAEDRQLGAASLFLGDERLPHPFRPQRDQPPSLPVGQPDLRCRGRQLSGVLDRFQKAEKVGVDLPSGLTPRRPDEVEVERRTNF